MLLWATPLNPRLKVCETHSGQHSKQPSFSTHSRRLTFPVPSCAGRTGLADTRPEVGHEPHPRRPRREQSAVVIAASRPEAPYADVERHVLLHRCGHETVRLRCVSLWAEARMRKAPVRGTKEGPADSVARNDLGAWQRPVHWQGLGLSSLALTAVCRSPSRLGRRASENQAVNFHGESCHRHRVQAPGCDENVWPTASAISKGESDMHGNGAWVLARHGQGHGTGVHFCFRGL